jgi:two-component system sensor histidine kinase RpfC
MSEAAGESALTNRLRRFPPLARIAARLRARPDSEHEMAINRLVISLLIMSYLLIALALGHSDVHEALVTISVFSVCSVAFFVHILISPGISVARRVLAIVVDLGMLSWGMHAGDEVTSLLYPMYLWAIFGNGFRFGLKYLFFAMVVSVAGFSVVVSTTDYWSSHPYVGGGLLGGLIILPLYAATLIRKLSAARQQAEEASRAKSLFLASVSHELRTPLNAIIGLSDLLAGSRMDSEQKEMTHTIGQSGRSLLALINSILDFARIEAGHMPKNSVEFDVYALVAEIRRMLAVQADAKNIALAVHISPRMPRLLRGPRSHLSEILMNLASNAVKFTERGHVVVAADAIDVAGARARLRFEVADTGIGIDPKAQGRIFESFVQADETIIDRFGGTGLGLALVKQLVELHGGKIGVDSTPGVGSTFWCELDVETGAAEAPAAPPCGISVVLQSSDQALRDAIEAAGVEVAASRDAASTATIAAQLVKKNRRPLIVADIRSIAGGMDACADIVRAAWPPALPAILVTDRCFDGLLDGSARSRFVTSLARPVDAVALGNALAIAGACDPRERGDEACAVIPTAQRRLRVLVAEDNRTNQKVIEKILERAGHRTQIVENGEEALDALTEQAFDIVLMDVNMPVMNGIETTKLYRFASLGQRHVPIVALTADANPEMEARCREAGMDFCLTKPVEAARLVAVIAQMAGASADEEVDPVPLASTIGASDPGPAGAPAPPVLNLRVLDDLRSLGGNAFVSELAGQFLADAASLLGSLATAVRQADVQAFRDHVHALRSASANIGADGVYQLCLSWRRISSGELESQGESHVDKLASQLERVRAALLKYTVEMNGMHSGEPLARVRLVAGGR